MPTFLLNGPGYFLRGLQLLGHPRIRWFVVVPLAINICLFIGLTLFAIDQFEGLLKWLVGFMPDWLDFLAWIIWVFFGGLLLLVYGYSFAIIGNLLASPFYGLMVARLSEVLDKDSDETPLTMALALTIGWQSLKRELAKLRYFLPRIIGVVILTLILSFIPVLNLLAPVVAFLWGAWSLALQYLDYPADNGDMPFDYLRTTMSGKRFAALSFGGTVLITTTIPVLNLIAIPASVAGATVMWLERVKPANS